MPLNVKIEKIEEAEGALATLSTQETQMRKLYMQDGIIDATEQDALDRIKQKIDKLGSVVAELRAEIERNKAIWEGRAGDLGAAQNQLAELRAFEHPEAELVAGEFDPIDPAVADQRWADATAALDQVQVSMGPVYDDYVQQSAAQAVYDPARIEFDSRLAAAEAAEPQSENIAALISSIQGSLGPIDEAVAARNYIQAQEVLAISVGELDLLEEEIRVLQAAKAEFDARMDALRPVIEAVSVCEFVTLTETQEQVVQIQTRMEAAAATHDYATATEVSVELEAVAAPLQTRITEMQAQRAEFESAYAPLEARTAQINSSELSTTSEAAQAMLDLQAQIETAVTSEDYVGALAFLPGLDATLVTIEKILEDWGLYETRLAAIQEELLEASVSQAKWAYLLPIQTQLAGIQTQMEAAATAENFALALEQIALLEAKLVEFFEALEAKHTEYTAARAAFDRQVSAAQGNSTDALKTQLNAILATVPPIDKAAGEEDWVAAMAAITAAQPKIDAFNVAMYRAELPGMTTGMSDDALKLAGRSPEMTEQLEDLRDDGWQVVLGTPGGGSSCNKSAKIITMDPNNLTNAGDTIRTMAHEAGHAGYEKTTDLSSREAYLNGELGDEGQATLNNIEIQREILANGGPDIGISGNSANHAAYNAAFDEYEKTGDEAAARDAIAAIFGAGEVPSVKKPDGTPYADYNEYYGSWYDANVP